jgi:hypothetical protein
MLGLGRAPSWVVLSGPARHGWACLVPCSDGVASPSGGPARPGYHIGLKRPRLKRARAGPGRAARLDIYTPGSNGPGSSDVGRTVVMVLIERKKIVFVVC